MLAFIPHSEDQTIQIQRLNQNQERINGTEKASPIHDHRSQGGLDNSQSHNANVFRVNDLRSEPRVLHELKQNKMAESDIAIAIRCSLCRRKRLQKDFC